MERHVTTPRAISSNVETISKLKRKVYFYNKGLMVTEGDTQKMPQKINLPSCRDS
jgi:hypothetical protein